MDKTDCFAYRIPKNGKRCCDALKKLDCEKCSFYKTKEQNEREDKR